METEARNGHVTSPGLLTLPVSTMILGTFQWKNQTKTLLMKEMEIFMRRTQAHKGRENEK